MNIPFMFAVANSYHEARVQPSNWGLGAMRLWLLCEVHGIRTASTFGGNVNLASPDHTTIVTLSFSLELLLKQAFVIVWVGCIGYGSRERDAATSFSERLSSSEPFGPQLQFQAWGLLPHCGDGGVPMQRSLVRARQSRRSLAANDSPAHCAR